jgi:hypothetical protein
MRHSANRSTEGTDLAGDMVSNINFLIIEQHAIDGLDGTLCGFCSLVMDETVSPRATVFIGGHFTR